MPDVKTRAAPRQMPSKRLRSGLARYRQIYLNLKTQIQDGDLLPGASLPSEPELAQQFGVSRITIRQSLGLLEQEGWVSRRHGVGTFVQAKERPEPAEPDLHGPLEALITLGVETTAVLLRADWLKPGERLRTRLGAAEDEEVFRLQRKRSAGGEPFSHTSILLRREMAERLDLETLGDAPVIAALESTGVRAHYAEQGLGATLAEPDAAEALEVDVGAPLTRLRRTVFDADGRAILYQISLYRPDRFEYRMTLNRTRERGGPSWRPA